MDVASLIEALSSPAAYAHPVDAVDVQQTHISVVFLAGPHAYKLKKPVNLGFVDFSTLAKRRHFCEEEVRLNRRLAHEVYRGVVPVVRTPQGVQFEGEGEVVEWAVKMQRLPHEATIQERLRRGEIGIELVETLGRRIASFHRAADANERIAAFGRFGAVARTVRDIYAQAAPHVGTTVSKPVFGRVQAQAEQALSRLRRLIEERATRGVTRDCHGDLRLDHVYFFPGRAPPADWVIIDSIEFNERFRFIDPVADMAFPAMDFAFFGRRDLADAFTAAYFRASGDEEGRALLPLYLAYRATVRAAVEGLLLTENEVAEAERLAAHQRARAHWLQALTELEQPERKPCLLLVAGLPGTGKSRLAQGLAERAGFSILRSDVVRRKLAGLPSQGQTPSRLPESFYSPEWNKRTYAECLRGAERLVFEGKRVLVDATFREEQQRQIFLEAAVRWGVPGCLILCAANPNTVRQRLGKRKGDPSDADWSVYLQVAEAWEDIGPSTRRRLLEVSTEGTPAQSLLRALRGLHALGLWGESERGDT
jgi:aminoglycoside phosphotransferase family enzyme/predicted kinase